MPYGKLEGMRRALLIPLILSALLVSSLVVTGCEKFGGPVPLEKPELEESEHNQFPPEGQEAKDQVEERERVKIADVLSSALRVPEEEARKANPLAATEQNLESGRIAYNNECTKCHGLAGFGDGEAAKSLKPRPTDLHEEHVQLLPDGALFYVIKHGIEGTQMPGVQGRMGDEQIWQVVLFVRTFDRFRSPAIVD